MPQREIQTTQPWWEIKTQDIERHDEDRKDIKSIYLVFPDNCYRV